jgi:hypothetical protein
MTGRLWLNHFTRIVVSEHQKHPQGVKGGDSGWTEFMQSVMDRVAEVMNCRVARIRPENEDESGEYLNIDAMYIDNAAYIPKNKYDRYDPFVLPRAVVELENSDKLDKISYCLWKILCIRAPIRVLICYQRGADKIITLKQCLEDVIWQGSLMKESDGDLLVIIGDDRLRDEASWEEYFSIFEWRSDELERIEDLEWQSIPS